MSKVLLIVNPSSGGEKAKAFEALAKDKLAQHFTDLVLKHTQKAGDACRFAKTAARDHFDAVFVMGGDGTVNEGISGLAEEEYRPKFGFFPLGTVNDLARALKMPLDPQEAIEQLELLKTRPLDIGKVNDHYFMNVVAIGTIPESVNNVEPTEKTRFGKLAYFISAIRQLRDTQSHRFQLTLDHKRQAIETSMILIGLTNSIGGFEQLLPQAKVDDGKLHVIYLKDKTILETIKALPSLVSGVEESDQSLYYHRVQTAEICLEASDDILTINVDGDEGDDLPVKLCILPKHLEVYA